MKQTGFEINKKDFLIAVNYSKKHLEFTKFGIEITKSKDDDSWLIWNIRNTFLGFYEFELIGHARFSEDDNVMIVIDSDMREDFDALFNGYESLYDGAIRVLTDMNNALRHE